MTNTNSSGPGSLSQAIGDLNQTGDEKENKIIFEIPQGSGSTDPASLDTSLPEIKKPVTFENASGEDIKINSSRIRPFYAYGIYADKSFGIDALSGNVSGTAIGLGYSKAYGIFADDNITIGMLSGNVSGTGVTLGLFGGYASAYGLYAGYDITIGTLLGTVSGTARSVGVGAGVGNERTIGISGTYTSAYGLYAGKDITIDTLSGTVSGTGMAGGIGFGGEGWQQLDGKSFRGLSISGASVTAYGLYADKDITIDTLSGNVSGTGTAGGVGLIVAASTSGYGLYAQDNITIRRLSSTVEGTGKVFGGIIGAGSASAYGLYAGKDINIGIVSGEVKAQSTNY